MVIGVIGLRVTCYESECSHVVIRSNIGGIPLCNCLSWYLRWTIIVIEKRIGTILLWQWGSVTNL